MGEKLGFTSIRTVEHYFHPYGGYTPNPLVFLTAAAMVTRKCRLQTGAVLPVDGLSASACIIASNTSTIPISTLAIALKEERRSRFIGTHYFSPVSRMRLVEVIPGFETSANVVDQMRDPLEQIGKEPIKVKDVAGFAVNRMLHAFLIEAVRLWRRELLLWKTSTSHANWVWAIPSAPLN